LGAAARPVRLLPVSERAAGPCRVCGEASAAGLAPGRFALLGASAGLGNNAPRPASAPAPLSPRYWANLKLWFKQKISKEEFDLEARRLLTQDNGKRTPFVCFPAVPDAALPLPGLGAVPPCPTSLPQRGNGCEGSENS